MSCLALCRQTSATRPRAALITTRDSSTKVFILGGLCTTTVVTAGESGGGLFGPAMGEAVSCGHGARAARLGRVAPTRRGQGAAARRVRRHVTASGGRALPGGVFKQRISKSPEVALPVEHWHSKVVTHKKAPEV